MEDIPPSAAHTESQTSASKRNGGGWITFPFIMGTAAGLTLAGTGWLLNLIVFLIREFNVKSIDAAQISNVVNGCVSLFPVLGAVIADSFLGSFSVIAISSCISLLGILMLALTSTIKQLMPKPCESGSLINSLCQSPTKLQYAILYIGIGLASIGIGGTRFTTATMGANQFDKSKHQNVFFNWYFFTFYTASVVSATAIVYIEDNVGWGWGLGICIGANFIGLAVFLLGNRFYRHDKPQGSPFINLARVFVATIQKWRVEVPSLSEDYYYGQDGLTKTVEDATPKKSFRFLNRAALKTEGDTNIDGSIAKPWRLCTVQQVEDFKTLIRIFPLWSTAIFLSTPIAIQGSLTVLQALAMDRHLGPNFQIPPGSFIILILITTSISLTLIDRLLSPTCQKLTGWTPTPLQRVGAGHVFNVLGMIVSAIVETKRLTVAHHSQQVHDQPGTPVPMLALWLFPQLVLVGLGEAFHFPGQVALYYQEFPVSLKSTATAMIAMVIGIAYYLSTALVDLIRRVTNWLPDDINKGRLDNVYWVVAIFGVVNFGYYLVCAKLYKYQNVNKEIDGGSHPHM